MTLPLAGPLIVLSTFGAERDGGERDHKGIDLAAPRLTPVLAVRDGVVTRINRAGVSVFIRHDDGWSSWYLHLNNDTYLTDDGLGGGVAPGLEEGDRVVAGQVIGWVGDSGNAEPTPPHLHFELRTPWGEPIDPLRSLRAAAWVDEAVPVDFEGAFWDDEEAEVAPIADLLASLALITGCGPYGLELCPDAVLTGGDVENLLGAALGTEVPVGVFLQFGTAPGTETGDLSSRRWTWRKHSVAGSGSTARNRSSPVAIWPRSWHRSVSSQPMPTISSTTKSITPRSRSMPS